MSIAHFVSQQCTYVDINHSLCQHIHSRIVLSVSTDHPLPTNLHPSSLFNTFQLYATLKSFRVYLRNFQQVFFEKYNFIKLHMKLIKFEI